MKTITEHGPMIFSRLERARIEHDIRRENWKAFAWMLATGAALLLIGVLLAVGAEFC